MARIEALHKAVYRGDQKGAVAAAKEALKAETPLEELTNESLIPAMKKIGSDFEEGKVFIPEMLVAARAMDGVMKLFEPVCSQNSSRAHS
jgi:methanogenic corrinoid protein MtbC1